MQLIRDYTQAGLCPGNVIRSRLHSGDRSPSTPASQLSASAAGPSRVELEHRGRLTCLQTEHPTFNIQHPTSNGRKKATRSLHLNGQDEHRTAVLVETALQLEHGFAQLRHFFRLVRHCGHKSYSSSSNRYPTADSVTMSSGWDGFFSIFSRKCAMWTRR